ncbi:MAG TPA: M48 family metalloprotease, partial [Acidimicrobiia bacterium]|nr:M48 family metalloprotease [Acidimicrobiia bacterium]
MSKNTIKTALLLSALGAFFVFVGGAFFGGGGATIGLVIAFVFVGGSYWFSDKLAVAAARGQEVSEQEAPDLYAMVSGLAQQAGMPMPRLYVSPMEQPNAFATGRNPKHAAVCVTQGILQVLETEELRGVLAHELGHVRNRDILISSVAAA